MTARGRSRLFHSAVILALVLSWGVASADLLPSAPTGKVSPAPEPAPSAEPAKAPVSTSVSVDGKGFRAELSSAEALDGSLLLVSLHLSDDDLKKFDAKATFEDVDAPFFEASPGVLEAFIAVPHNHTPGKASVEVQFLGREGGVERKASIPFAVIDAHYPSEVLKVDPRKINPRKKDLIRIKRESHEVAQIYKVVTKEKYWNGPFTLPINSKMTSQYGTKRVFNGELKSFHNGLDLKAAVGTPIHSSAAGVVVMAKNLFFTGNTVLVDHGYGVITLYAHMSKLKVKKGQKVKAGQLLGLSGRTGRVNGPHLHFAVTVHSSKVNPLDALKVIH